MNLVLQSYDFEQAIGHLLALAGVVIVSTPSDLTRVDYVFLDNFGERIAIEARGHGFQGEPRQLTQLAKLVGPVASRIRKLILVTPFKPDAKSIKALVEAFAGMPNDVEWFSDQELAESLGLHEWSSHDLNTRRSQRREYRDRALGTADKPTQDRSWPGLVDQPDLARQLSRATIHRLQESSKSPEVFLRIGERVPVVIVLSDIQNFSLLVKAAKPDDLNNAMAKYYRLARALAWSYGGVLDKFIGDAVLTIFNYPYSEEDAHIKAVRFASDLIEIGKPIFGGLLNLINEAINTGTRVGISTGEVSVLNIGLRGLELSFVGDVINLAARLEHESDLNGFLVDNLTKGAIFKHDHKFFEQLSLVKRELSHERVKGQLTSIQAWQVPSSVISDIADLERDLTVGL
ncbi:MAG TPA: adenylate/guanylate cyclase domain-containing protein [Pyrinomonadaceae bacterium]|nr:adenylate/guanylate cyclase domain-containing protein [Pyrinomonadaceae bacterium]